MRALARLVGSLTRPGYRSIWGVVVVTAAALAAGWWLRSAVLGATRQVEAGGVVARVPADWLVQRGVGELVFTARSPSGPLRRYSVTRLDESGGIPLDGLAADRAAARSRSLVAHRVLDEGADQLDGRTAYRVDYAYVQDDARRIPSVLLGREILVRAGEDVLVMVLEAEDRAFETAWQRLEGLIGAVQLTSGPATDGGTPP